MKLLTVSAVLLTVFISEIRAASICCAYIGCFTDDPPYDGQPLPWCTTDMNPLVYTMYTRSNRLVGQEFTHSSSVPSVFSGARRTVFIAHGWQSNGGSAWLGEMKDAFLDREDINVVIVNWGGGADILDYPQAAANTRSTGAYTALVFDNLKANGGVSSRMWCTGHSLGAHMCGHTGMRTTLQRVTGMDPAGPWFESNPDPTVGLNPTSANFVDVIHTDYTYGTERSLGHIDFYPNGGHDQPGCSNEMEIVDGKELTGCSHGRGHEYMFESIKSDCFLSFQSCSDYNNLPGSCTSCSCSGSACGIMGYGADNGCRTSGLFYVNVVATAPYCTGR